MPARSGPGISPRLLLLDHRGRRAGRPRRADLVEVHRHRVERLEGAEQVQVLLDQVDHQEVLLYGLSGPLAHLNLQIRVPHQLHDPPGRLLDGAHQEAVDAVLDLVAEPSHVAGDHRGALPHGLGGGQPEALPDGLLEHHRGLALQRVHQPAVLPGEDDDVIVLRVQERPVDLVAFRVVGGDVAEEHQPGVHLLPGHLERLDHSLGVLPAVEAGDLGDQRKVGGDVVEGQPLLHLLVAHEPVGERERVGVLELLADEQVFGLNDEEMLELAELEKAFPELAGDTTFEAAAAAFHLASVDEIEPIPVNLMNRISADAARYFDDVEQSELMSSIGEEVESPRSASGYMQWLGWAFAGASSILLVLNMWVIGPQTRQQAKVEVPVEKKLTVAEKRQSLIASAKNLIKSEWTSTQKDLAVNGDVVWNEEKQEGYMTFRGLPVNDTKKETYQLWIFDEAQPEATPVDGGVFDVDADGEVTIPIDAKIAVQEPKAFAVTVEKPGGVVVSKREKIVALAKV